MWPQGCSIRHRATKFGARSCDGLKKAALPRQALVMLDATVVPPIVAVPVAVPLIAGVVSAAHEAAVGIWFVSVKEGAERPGEVGARVLGRNRHRHAVGQRVGVADLRRARHEGRAGLTAE